MPEGQGRTLPAMAALTITVSKEGLSQPIALDRSSVLSRLGFSPALCCAEAMTPAYPRGAGVVRRDEPAGSRGFEPPISALTGPHVRPLHHEPSAATS
jgi:hypothetical protein